MRVHVLQHVEFEDLGFIKTWLAEKAAMVTYTRFFAGDSLPDPKEIDFIIALGGPMSVNDEEQFPWLVEEKQFIAKAIRKNKIVLGICLGSQLIANALGSKVYANKEKEIGWFPVYAQHKPNGGLHLPSGLEVFHWHGETFDLPKGAHLLASSVACKNQAFQIGKRIIGLQFHLETTPESADKIIANCEQEIQSERFIQTKLEMCCIPSINYKIINSFMAQVLEYLCATLPVAV